MNFLFFIIVFSLFMTIGHTLVELFIYVKRSYELQYIIGAFGVVILIIVYRLKLVDLLALTDRTRNRIFGITIFSVVNGVTATLLYVTFCSVFSCNRQRFTMSAGLTLLIFLGSVVGVVASALSFLFIMAVIHSN